MDEKDLLKVENLAKNKTNLNLSDLDNLANNFYNSNCKINDETNSKESLSHIGNNNLSIKGEILNNSEIINLNNTNDEENKHGSSHFFNSETNSFLNISDDSLIFQNNKSENNLKFNLIKSLENLKSKSKPLLANSSSVNNLANTKPSNNLKENSNIQSIKIRTNLNTNANSLIKAKSPVKISSDKLIFIKTQMKNDTANFTNYGK